MTSDEVIALKAEVRRRDGFACAECGVPNHEHIAAHGRQLDVHRVAPGSEYSLAPGVCVTLCRRCHSKKPRLPHGSLPKRPGRLIALPEPLAAALEELAAEQFTTLTRQVVTACLEYLGRHDRLPPPKPAR